MLTRSLTRPVLVVASSQGSTLRSKPVPQRMPPAELREHANMWGDKAVQAERRAVACLGVAAAAQVAQYAIIGRQVFDGIMEIPMRTAFMGRRETFIELGKYMGPIVGVMGLQALSERSLRRKADQLGNEAAFYRGFQAEITEDLRVQQAQRDAQPQEPERPSA